MLKGTAALQYSTPCIYCSTSPLATDAKQQVEKNLGISLKSEYSVHCVRDVAPKKAMVCVSFKLPESVAFADIERRGVELKREREDHSKFHKNI